MSRILVVDDEPAILSFMKTLLTRDGHDVVCAEGGEQAQQELEGAPFDLLITDYMMTPMDGLALLKFAQREFPNVPAIMISGYCSVQNAVEVLKAGAFDYLPKPVKIDELREIIARALEYHHALVQSETHSVHRGPGGVIAESPGMRDVCELMKRVMPTRSSALILGETGTGKELVARIIHDHGVTRSGSFVRVDCGTRPVEALAEDLFGGMTSPDLSPSGKFQQAQAGTLYLSEIGSLPIELQERLDRILSQEYTPGSGRAGIGVGVRVIAGSKDPLEDMVQKGNFSRSLHQRLRVFSMSVPALRERRQDIVGLAYEALGSLSDDQTTIERDAELVMEHYIWPGNVDELFEVVSTAGKTSANGAIRVEDLPGRLVAAVDLDLLKSQRSTELASYKGKALKSFLRGKEQEYLEAVLESVNDNKAEAASKLDLDAEGLERHISGENA